MDVYQKNSLTLGDCLTVLPQIPDASFDAIIADLPYGTTAAAWDATIPLDLLWKEYDRLLKPHGSTILFAAQPFTSTLICSNISNFKYCWYWTKEKGTGFLNSKSQPLRTTEEICVFANSSKITYNPQMTPLEKPYTHSLPNKQSTLNGSGVKSIDRPDEKREYKTYTHACPKNSLHFPRDKANKSLVPTQKPLALLEYIIRTHTNENDHILDNTMGSGTTCLAAQKLGRFYTGIEKNERHFEIAKKRLHPKN
jgi:site-specific DNA-methyltransferase (adenine-specific)